MIRQNTIYKNTKTTFTSSITITKQNNKTKQNKDNDSARTKNILRQVSLKLYHH